MRSLGFSVTSADGGSTRYDPGQPTVEMTCFARCSLPARGLLTHAFTHFCACFQICTLFNPKRCSRKDFKHYCPHCILGHLSYTGSNQALFDEMKIKQTPQLQCLRASSTHLSPAASCRELCNYSYTVLYIPARMQSSSLTVTTVCFTRLAEVSNERVHRRSRASFIVGRAPIHCAGPGHRYIACRSRPYYAHSGCVMCDTGTCCVST